MLVRFQQARKATAENGREPLGIALRMLLRAYNYARHARANRWQFAIELEESFDMLVSDSD